MNLMYNIVFILGLIGSAFALFGFLLALKMLIKHEDVEYRKRYNDFLSQKQRVEGQLGRISGGQS
jgi:hypothetical protein